MNPLPEPGAAALPSHPDPDTTGEGAAPVATLPPLRPLPGTAQVNTARGQGGGAGWEAHIRLQGGTRLPASLHATVKSGMAYAAREGGAATSRCQAGASRRNKQDCPGGTSSTCHPLATCLRGGTKVPNTRGTGWRTARAHGLPSITSPCGDPADMRLFPVRLPGAGQGALGWKRSPATAQSSPTTARPRPLLPPLPRRHRWPTLHSQSQDSQQSPGKIQGSESHSRMAEKCRARRGRGQGDTTTRHRIGAELLQSSSRAVCHSLEGKGRARLRSAQAPGSKHSPGMSWRASGTGRPSPAA